MDVLRETDFNLASMLRMFLKRNLIVENFEDDRMIKHQDVIEVVKQRLGSGRSGVLIALRHGTKRKGKVRVEVYYVSSGGGIRKIVSSDDFKALEGKSLSKNELEKWVEVLWNLKVEDVGDFLFGYIRRNIDMILSPFVEFSYIGEKAGKSLKRKKCSSCIYNRMIIADSRAFKRIYDPVHGIMEFSWDEMLIVDSCYLQRLKDISQMAFFLSTFPHC